MRDLLLHILNFSNICEDHKVYSCNVNLPLGPVHGSGPEYRKDSRAVGVPWPYPGLQARCK